MTANWAKGPLVGFDVETTSKLPTEARIVTASIIAVQSAPEPDVIEWLADPGIDIPGVLERATLVENEADYWPLRIGEDIDVNQTTAETLWSPADNELPHDVWLMLAQGYDA